MGLNNWGKDKIHHFICTVSFHHLFIFLPAKDNDGRGGAGYVGSCSSTVLKKHQETSTKNSKHIVWGCTFQRDIWESVFCIHSLWNWHYPQIVESDEADVELQIFIYQRCAASNYLSGEVVKIPYILTSQKLLPSMCLEFKYIFSEDLDF